MPSFYEFFAGGGMARAGLGKGWICLLANDFDAKKGLTWGPPFARLLWLMGPPFRSPSVAQGPPFRSPSVAQRPAPPFVSQ